MGIKTAEVKPIISDRCFTSAVRYLGWLWIQGSIMNVYIHWGG